MSQILLIVCAALLPVAIALYLIYNKDNNQPEPFNVLAKTFFLGVLSAPLSMLISQPLAAMGVFSDDSTTLLGRISEAFFGAAIPEECMKLLMLWVAVRKNRYFDEHFDGIVYAVFIGMGFAAIENVMYLFGAGDNWIGIGVNRAFFSIPGHFFFAILMGYFYSIAHFTTNIVKKQRCMLWMIAAPVLAHGIYDGLLMVQDVLPGIAGLLTIGVIYLLNKLRKMTSGHIEHLLHKDGII